MNEPAELPTGDAIAAEFSQKGYVFLQSALEAPRAALLYGHTVCLANRGGWRSDAQVPNTPAWYAEHRMEALLLELLPRNRRSQCRQPASDLLLPAPIQAGR